MLQNSGNKLCTKPRNTLQIHQKENEGGKVYTDLFYGFNFAHTKPNGEASVNSLNLEFGS